MAITFDDAVEASGGATGEIIDESDLIAFLGTNALQLMSQQGGDTPSIDVPNVQGAIDKAEARAKGILGNWFSVPLTVGGVVIKDSTSAIAKPMIVTACCQYAAFWLNKWRAVQSADGGSGLMSQAEIDRLASAWEADADADLKMMGRWALGYSDGLSVDLDLLSTMPRSTATDGLSAVEVIRPHQCATIGHWIW